MMKNFFRCALMLVCFLSMQASAYAANCPTTSIPRPGSNSGRFEIGACATRYTGIAYGQHEFTTKLVACIEGTIHGAVLGMMNVISTQFAWVVTVLSTLVIMFFGVRIAMGERELLKRTSTLAIKLAFVSVFMSMLPEVVDWVFEILRDLLRLVVGGVSPWQRIDQFLGNLMGFSSGVTLINGLVGLVGAAAFSSTVGISMFFFGMMGILKLLTFILELIYTYLLAFLTIGFLLILMPIMIPLALFFYTERYFKKWTEIIVSVILTPVLIFAFVYMFIGIFDILIQNIFNILGGNDFRAYWRLNSSLCSWMMPSDPNTNLMMQKLSTAQDVPCVQRTVLPPVQTNISPLSRNSFDACTARLATLNFGANDVNIVQRLTFAFTSLWIFASLMKSMIGLLPQVAQSIASVVNTGIPVGGNSAVLERMKGGLAKAENKLQSGMANTQKAANNAASFATQIGNLLGNRKT